MKNMQINPNIHRLLLELSHNRKIDDKPNSSMTAIVSELVMKQHAKECKK